MASIYELNKDYAELSAMLETAEIVNINSDIDGVKAEIERLTAIKKQKENMVNRLKGNIEFSLKEQGLDKLTVGTFKCGYRKSESVEIDNLDVIPADYTKVEIKADKTAIKKALKAGEEVAGARIQENLNFYIK